MVSISVRQLISEFPVLDLGPKGFLLGFQRAIKLDPGKSLGKMNHKVQTSWLTTLTFCIYVCIHIFIYIHTYMCSTYLLSAFYSATKIHTEPLAAKYIVKGSLIGIII